MKIKIITDSGSDLPKETAEKLGVTIVPLWCSYDGENYFLSDSVSNIDYAKKIAETDTIPKTSQARPDQFEKAYRDAVKDGYDTIIAVALASESSGTCQNANIAAQTVMEDTKCDITVIDSHTLCVMYALAVIEGAKKANDGGTKEEVIEAIQTSLDDYKVVFMVKELEHLKKNGRINTATLMALNMLEIKPVLNIKGGLVCQHSMIKGSKKRIAKFLKIACDEGLVLKDIKKVLIAHSLVDDEVAELETLIKEENPDILIEKMEIGPLIASHAGPHLLGLVFNPKNS